jgi:hypothetical protein
MKKWTMNYFQTWSGFTPEKIAHQISMAIVEQSGILIQNIKVAVFNTMSILYHLYENVASVYYYGFLLPRFVR